MGQYTLVARCSRSLSHGPAYKRDTRSLCRQNPSTLSTPVHLSALATPDQLLTIAPLVHLLALSTFVRQSALPTLVHLLKPSIVVTRLVASRNDTCQ